MNALPSDALRSDLYRVAACIAAQKNNVEILRSCLSRGIALDEHFDQAVAIGHGKDDVLSGLLQEHARTDTSTSSGLRSIEGSSTLEYETGGHEVEWTMQNSKSKKKRKGRHRFRGPSNGRDA